MMIFLCWIVGHKWINHVGMRIRGDAYIGSISGSGLKCLRCGKRRG